MTIILQPKLLVLSDVVNNNKVITDYPLSENTSTPEFDGLKLTILDSPNEVDTSKTTFNNPTFKSYSYLLFTLQK